MPGGGWGVCGHLVLSRACGQHRSFSGCAFSLENSCAAPRGHHHDGQQVALSLTVQRTLCTCQAAVRVRFLSFTEKSLKILLIVKIFFI